MINGTKPQRIKRLDFDFLKTFHPEIIAGAATPQFPAEYLTDKAGDKPNQNTDGLPYACTSYTTAKLARILGVAYADRDDIETLTNSNAKGGYGVLAAIDMARTKLKWFNWRYVIQAKGNLDWFDAHRLAQVSGLPETRAISVGTPWFPSWERAALAGVRVMPMPTAQELAQIKSNPNSMGWHNYLLDGWSQNFTEAPGRLLYRLDSWQGLVDYLYLDRAVMNVVFDLYGTVSVTGTNMDVLPAKVPLPDWFWSLWHSWLGYSY